MNQLKIWTMAARPKTLPAAAAPVIIGSALAAGSGGFHFPSALAALFGALLIQIGTNFANDYFDFQKGTDTSARIGPTRVTQSGLASPGQVRTAFIAAFGLAGLAGLYLVFRGGFPVIVIGLSSIAAGILYTGGPRPYGYSGLGDIFVFIFFGLVAVGGTFYVQTRSISSEALIAGAGPGFLATAILVVNNLRDRVSDAATGKNTLAVRLGAGFARMEYIFCVGSAAAVPCILVFRTEGHTFSLLALPPLFLALGPLRTLFRENDGPAMNTALASTGRVLLLYSLFFSLGWLL